MNFKTLLNISSKYPNPVRNLQCSEFEIDNWIISEFILKELVPIVGIYPYPLNELMLMTAALCVIKPTHIFEWGTHVGKSARIFYEVTKRFNITCEIHSIDLPDNTQHKEHLQQNRGLLVKNIPEIKLHQGDGLATSLSLYKNISTKSYLLFFLDGDHDYYSVKRELKGIIKNISDLDNKRKKITDEIKEIPVYNIDIIKKNLEGMTAKERNLEIGIARTEKEIESSLSELNRLNNSISRKTKIKNNIDKIEEILHLTNEYFLSLVDVMEKNIMAKIYDDFNSLFQKWFNVLMNEENISVALENDFTPVIEQNGYHIQYDDLSGGEKTAAALAYRLALNQVINNIVSTIKTKDIIILDEPTDGFSEEQIDRIRDVLNELNMKQIIIVSHEPKIETFVDTVIRLQKNEHVTKIIS